MSEKRVVRVVVEYEAELIEPDAARVQQEEDDPLAGGAEGLKAQLAGSLRRDPDAYSRMLRQAVLEDLAARLAEGHSEADLLSASEQLGAGDAARVRSALLTGELRAADLLHLVPGEVRVQVLRSL